MVEEDAIYGKYVIGLTIVNSLPISKDLCNTVGTACVTFSLGMIGSDITGASVFSTPHAYLGLILLFIFGAGAAIALQILDGNLNLIRKHGRIMLFGGVLILFQILGGIRNLNELGII